MGASKSSRWSHLTGNEGKKGKLLKITDVWKGVVQVAKAKSAGVLSEDNYYSKSNPIDVIK